MSVIQCVSDIYFQAFWVMRKKKKKKHKESQQSCFGLIFTQQTTKKKKILMGCLYMSYYPSKKDVECTMSHILEIHYTS